jgi:diguanylate cyclase (GGDEF)-like protein
MRANREELSQLAAALDDMAQQLQARDAKLRDVLEELRAQAVTDALTGLYNRRYFWDALSRELIAARRKPTIFSVILMDLDWFKNVNDTWGHDAGDMVLKEAADLMRASVRGSDIAARYGGEEFALLLPETAACVAEERAESLRRELEAHEIAYGTSRIRITASFGVGQYDGSTSDAASLMKRIDAALYAAKDAGRNRVVVHEPARARGAGPVMERCAPPIPQ